MNQNDNIISQLPNSLIIGALILIGLFLFSVILLIFWTIRNRDVKIKGIEIVTKTQKELYRTEGRNTLDNQTSNAHNLLKKIWVDLYDVGRKKFNITSQAELFILEDIAHLIEDKLNYEVKCDLTRNHITEKSETELSRYSDAKAIGYYRNVKASLYSYNCQLPKYDLPEIMNNITLDEYKRIFNEIYFNAQKIAGDI